MSARIRSLTLCFFLSTGILGCGQAPAPPVTVVTPTRPQTGSTHSVSEAEAKAWAEACTQAVKQKDKFRCGQLLRLQGASERTISGLTLTVGFKQRFVQDAHALAEARIIAPLLSASNVQLVRVKREEGRTSVVLRVILSEEQGLNYLLCDLANFGPNAVAPSDMRFLLPGESLSLAYRRLLLKLVAEHEPLKLGTFTTAEQKYADQLPKIRTQQQMLHEQAYRLSLEAYYSLPTALQEEPILLLLALQAADRVGGAPFEKLLTQARAKLGNDPALALLLIDHYVRAKEPNEALKCVTELSQFVGNEPYLRVFRANLLSELGQVGPAKAEFDQAQQADPTLEPVYWERIGLALKEKNEADTLTWLKKLVEQGNVLLEAEKLVENPAYADFVTSPAFAELKAWLRTRPAK